MHQSIQMKIVDPHAVLTVMDKQHLKNMVWQQLEFMLDKIKEVRLGIERLCHGQMGCNPFLVEHLVSIETQLTSGNVIRFRVTRVSKGAALVVSIDRLTEKVARRIRIESSWLFRFNSQMQGGCKRLISSAREIISTPRTDQTRSVS